MALYVLDGGCAFEQAIMERGRGNPLFNFLFVLGSKEHTYYVWRLYSFAQVHQFYENEIYFLGIYWLQQIVYVLWVFSNIFWNYKVSLFKRSRKGMVRIKLYSYWCEYLLVKIMLDDLRTKVKEPILIHILETRDLNYIYYLWFMGQDHIRNCWHYLIE